MTSRREMEPCLTVLIVVAAAESSRFDDAEWCHGHSKSREARPFVALRMVGSQSRSRHSPLHASVTPAEAVTSWRRRRCEPL